MYGPYNIASYALLTHMVANFCDLEPGELVISSADTHIYANNIVDVRDLIRRTPGKPKKLFIKNQPKIFGDYTFGDFELI
jgi:thymidylate synthase